MSEYYAERESIEELSGELASNSVELDNSAMEISASAKTIARSQTLESLGYSNLTNRTQASVNKLSGKVKEISSILSTVSSLYADYEGRVIGVLDASVSGGNNYTKGSRRITRDESDKYVATPRTTGPSIADYTSPTAEQKRQYVHDWLEQKHPEILEQIYDRLHGGAGVAAAATVAGLGAAAGTGAADTGFAAESVSAESASSQPRAVSDVGTGASADVGAGGEAAGDDSWVADMLNDAVDSDAVQAAQSTLASAADVTNPAAVSQGAGTLSDSAAMDFATEEKGPFSQMLSDLESGFVNAVQKYGVNAGILMGGAGTAYAASGVAIEAVAHCAEFVATKCMPTIQGTMRQVSTAVRVTQVTIRASFSSIIQGVGGLVG